MTNLNGIEVPEHFNGIGLHDTPGSETATWDYNHSAAHAQELRTHGVTLYKLFGSGTKGERAKAYRDNGIVVLHRWWPGGPHWGKPAVEWLMPKVDYDYLLSCGVSLFEPGWNEFNIADEWVTSIPYAPGIARAVVDAWEEALSRYGGPDRLLFPSNTPGGHVDHRVCYQAIVSELVNRGLVETVRHVAIHPRPFNNPPTEKWSPTNTVTFDEWRWIRDQFEGVGIHAFFWATEHGYSLGDSQNANFPSIDLNRWTEFNWQLFLGMEKDIQPELAGTMYWFNAGWGHWGSWPKDALVDSPAPEMPDPSPLWVRMGVDSNALAFSRYVDDDPTPLPPPEKPAKGLYLSKYQEQTSRAALQALWDDGHRMIGFRVTGPNEYDAPTHTEVDPVFEEFYPIAKEIGFLTYGFHYLHPTLNEQAKDYANAVAGKTFELGLWGDVEHPGLDGNRCARFFRAADQRTGQTVHIYGRKNQLDLWRISDDGPWQLGRRLWLAAWTEDLTVQPTLPVSWEGTGYELWQWSNKGYLPGTTDRVCLDAWRGTTEELLDEYDTEKGEDDMWANVGFDDVQLIGMSRERFDTFWGKNMKRFVPVDPTEGSVYYRLIRLSWREGWCGCAVKVVDENGAPIEGEQIFQGWRDGDALPSDVAPVGGQPDGYPNRGNGGFTNASGDAGFGWGPGEWFDPTQKEGAHWYWRGGENGAFTDVVTGFGWWDEHEVIEPTFMKTIVEGGDDPNGDDETTCDEVLNRLDEITKTQEDILVSLSSIDASLADFRVQLSTGLANMAGDLA